MFVTHLKCSKCRLTYESEQIMQLCTCGGPLLVCYDLDRVKGAVSKEVLGTREPTLWRYREWLPIRQDENIVSLGEPMTPVIPLRKLGLELGIPHLYMKDEGLLPTGTFKARGATVGASRARELGVQVLAMPTNGNAGAAWAAYCQAAEIRAVVVMPTDSPTINQKECTITGASLYLVNGGIGDAGQLVTRAVEEFGWYNASTLREPYRIEGKKTMGLELLEQFNWQPPDVIVYPTGGGVGIIGIYKALQELQTMEWIGEKLPRLVAVQSTGCAPIVKAWKNQQKESQFWENAHTIAFGLTVPHALGDFLVLEAIHETNGCAVAVSDEEILEAQRLLARREGPFICPEGAATLSAAMRLTEEGWINSRERVLLLNTGAGLKYPETVQAAPPLLEPDDRLPNETES
jgi:threonine synthase